MPENKDQKNQAADEVRANALANEANPEELDLDALDLSVETAEERISPSETNVFDK